MAAAVTAEAAAVLERARGTVARWRALAEGAEARDPQWADRVRGAADRVEAVLANLDAMQAILMVTREAAALTERGAAPT